MAICDILDDKFQATVQLLTENGLHFEKEKGDSALKLYHSLTTIKECLLKITGMFLLKNSL